MDSQQLESLIAECLRNFYDSRLNRLKTLKLDTFLLRKNPYLFRARATEKASELVDQLLLAHLNASDETIFGNAFFEPIARVCSGGHVSDARGVDFSVEYDTRYLAVALKSGPNIFNADQKRRQAQNFNKLKGRLQKLNKEFDPLLAHAYGRIKSEPNMDRTYRIRAGQAFWSEITGDSEFYLKLIRLMKDEPQRRKEEFEQAWDGLSNRLTAEFIAKFCFEDGRIDWEKLVRFVSEEENTSEFARSRSKRNVL